MWWASTATSAPTHWAGDRPTGVDIGAVATIIGRRIATGRLSLMSVTEFVVVAVAVFAASFVQIIAGFGFALLCMPIMTIAIPVEQAVIISTLMGVFAVTWQAWYMRGDREPRLVRRLSLSAFLGMPLGLVVLHVFDDQTLRLILGVAVLVATALLVRRVDLVSAPPALDYGAGFLSGVLNTSLSTNGPPLVFALQARHLQPDQFRATINMVFAVSNVVTIVLFLVDGKITLEGLEAAGIALPAWALGQFAGFPLRSKVHGEGFRRLVLVLLFVAGASSIVFALV